jgi:hypothetical protein
MATTGRHKAFDLDHLPYAQQPLQRRGQGLAQIGLNQRQQLALALKMALKMELR